MRRYCNVRVPLPTIVGTSPFFIFIIMASCNSSTATPPLRVGRALSVSSISHTLGIAILHISQQVLEFHNRVILYDIRSSTKKSRMGPLYQG